jgi:flavin-dependent dehydrogenase
VTEWQETGTRYAGPDATNFDASHIDAVAVSRGHHAEPIALFRIAQAAMYDAIIVGARCAGSPTAILLARKGYRVLLVDRTAFPHDTISTHLIWPPGVARLKRWGLLANIVASGAPPFRQVAFDVGDFALVGTPPPVEGVSEIVAPRRTVLDKILVDAAVQAGAELRERFAVQELLSSNGRVSGIRAQDKSGAVYSEKARIVIGADGRHSVVARQVAAQEYDAKPALACWYYSYWEGVQADSAEYYSRTGRTFGIIPTNDGRVCVPVGWAHGEFTQFRSDVEANHLQTLDLAPALAERVRCGKRVERFYGTADVPNYFRVSYGPGWALVGDAGYHKDPITAQGISDAFHGAELLAEALDDGFSGRRPLDDALADYQRRRDTSLRAMYDFTCQLAAMEAPPPEMQQLFAALRDNQTQTDRFFGALSGTVPVPEFFARALPPCSRS